jgi:hypothetical protein
LEGEVSRAEILGLSLCGLGAFGFLWLAYLLDWRLSLLIGSAGSFALGAMILDGWV